MTDNTRLIADKLPQLPTIAESWITSYGASPDALPAVNQAAFDLADAGGQAVYVPPGDWETVTLPTGLYYGEGTITAEGDTLNLAATPTRVNTILAGGETTRLLSFALGPGAGSGMTDNARGCSLFGFNAGSGGLDAGRNSAFGSDTLTVATDVTYMDVFGSRAGKYTVWGNRCGFLMSNAGAWAGDPTPKVNAHDFWNEGSNPGRDAVWPPTETVPGTQDPGTGWRSLIEDGAGEPLAASLPTTHDHNEGNIAIGRDAYDHGVRGAGNAIVGHHAAEGWNINYCSVLGTDALEYGLTCTYTTAVGAFSLKHKMRGNFDTATGAYALHYLVHGYENTANGYKALWNLTGGSLVPATADLAAFWNVATGAYSAASLVSGKRNTFVGAGAAIDVTSGDDNVAVGSATFDQMASSTRGTAAGYRAGYLNTTGLTNWFCLGSLAGGLTLSNTGKIGDALTHVTVSGRLSSSRVSTTVASATGVTLTAAQIMQAVIVRSGAGAVTDTTPTAALIVAAIPGCEVGSSFEFRIANDNTDLLTIAAGAGVTLSRTTTVAPGHQRTFVAIVTNASAGTQAVTVIGLEASSASGQSGVRNLGQGTGTPLTGTLATTVLASVTIPGRAGGRTGLIRVITLWGLTNNANGKSPAITYGGTTFWAPAAASQANIGALRPPPADICFTGASAQVGFNSASNVGSASGGLTTGAVNSTVNQTLEITGTLSDVGDTMTLGYWRVDEVL